MQNWARLSAASRCLTKCGKSTNSIEWDCVNTAQGAGRLDLEKSAMPVVGSKSRGSNLTVQEDDELNKIHSHNDDSKA